MQGLHFPESCIDLFFVHNDPSDPIDCSISRISCRILPCISFFDESDTSLAVIASNHPSLILIGRHLFTCHISDHQFIKLFAFYDVRGFCHKAGSILNLRECNDIADAFASRHQHHHAVKPERHAAVGRYAVLKCLQKETETLPGLFIRKAKTVEHLLLQSWSWIRMLPPPISQPLSTMS